MSDELNRLQQAQQARRETLAQWRSSRLTELTLPSGMTVWAKDVSMTDLMLTGKLPDVMLDMAEDASKNGAVSVDLKKMAKNGAELAALMDTLVKLCVVEPPIADHGDDDHLGLDEISGTDKMFIFNWANREVEKLRPFREGEAQPVATVQPGDSIRIETQPNHLSGNGNGAVDA
jgi:hypothetical protein